MDNKQMKVDEYGRFINVQYPEGPVLESKVPIGPLSEPDWGSCEEVWARAERVKKLEDEIERAKTHIYNLRERVKILEITPLEKVSEESKNISDIANPLPFKKDRQEPPPLTFAQLQGSVKDLWDKVDALQLANYEITRNLSTMVTRKQVDIDWVEEELAAIKNLPNERICEHCKWADPGADKDTLCHYEPHLATHTRDWWCSKWEEK